MIICAMIWKRDKCDTFTKSRNVFNETDVLNVKIMLLVFWYIFLHVLILNSSSFIFFSYLLKHLFVLALGLRVLYWQIEQITTEIGSWYVNR